MAFKLHHSSNLTKFIIVGELLLVAYLFFTLTTSVYRGYQIDHYLDEFRQENDRIAMENKKLELDYSYITSNAYIEKMAKQNLNRINLGEEVIVILPDETGTLESGSDSNIHQSGDSERIKTLSNNEKWWKFFFDFPGNKS